VAPARPATWYVSAAVVALIIVIVVVYAATR